MKKIYCFFVITVLVINTVNLSGQAWEWAEKITSSNSGNVIIWDIDHDDNNNIYLCGEFENNLTIQNINVSSLGEEDIFLAKLSEDGDIIWIRKAGGKLGDVASGLTFDNFGNILLTGAFRDTAYFNTDSLISYDNRDAFIASYAPNGDLNWVKNALKGTANQYGQDIISDSKGNIILAGSFKNSVIIDADTIFSEKSNLNLCLTKFDSLGNRIWFKKFVVSNSDSKFRKLALSSTDDIYIGGFFQDSLFIESDTLISSNENYEDAVIIKIDSSGSVCSDLNNKPWVRHGGGNSYDRFYDVTVDEEDNLYFTGYITKTATFDSSGINMLDSRALTSNGYMDIVIGKYNNKGLLTWINTYGDSGEDIGEAIQYYDSILILSGNFAGTIVLGNDSLNNNSTSNNDIFCSKLQLSGDFIESQAITGTNYEKNYSLTVDQNGSFYLTGIFESDTLRCGSETLIGDSNVTKGFICKFETMNSIELPDLNFNICNRSHFPVYIKLLPDISISSFEVHLKGDFSSLDSLKINTDSSLSGDADWTFSVNETDSTLYIAAAGAYDITESGILFYLDFSILYSEPDTIPISINSVRLNEYDFPINTIDGSIIINEATVDTGDVSLNGEVTAYDASLVLKQLVDLTNLNCSQLANADYTGDYTISSLDAYYILMEASGIETTFEETDTTTSTSTSTIESLTVSEGEEYEVLITLPQEIITQSFYQKITYDNTQLELTDINCEGLTDNYSIISNSNNGTIKIAGASQESDIEQTEITASLSFSVIDEKSFTSTQVILEKVQINEDYISLNPGYVTLSSSSTSDLNTSIETQELSVNNYPNPFNESSTIDVFIPESQQVRISIFDINGRIVNTLIDEELSSGMHSFNWNTYDNNGDQLSAGYYFIKVFTMDKVVTNKALKIK